MKPDPTAPRALVIEDHPLIVEAVAEILETLGHTWEEAGTVEEAVAKADGGSFDYILCDLELPLRYGRLPHLDNGLNLIETLSRMPSCSGRPIIAMTAHGDATNLELETKRRGAGDFVRKPFPSTGHTLPEAIRLALQPSLAAPKKTVGGAMGSGAFMESD